MSRRRPGLGRTPQAIEDALDGLRVGDEADHAHRACTAGTDERIDFVDAPQQVRPALAHGRSGGGRCCLGIGVMLDVGGLVAPTLSPGGIGVATMVAHQMLARRRDLGQDPRDVFHGVDALGRRGGRVVAIALWEVQHLVSARQELQASQAHGRPHQVADQGLESGLIARRDVDGVVDGETRVPP